MCISDKMKAAIHETHGKEYTTGQSRDVVGYAAGGTTEDYAYDDLQIPLTWGATATQHKPSSNSQARANFTAFEKDGLKLTMFLVKETTGATEMDIACHFSNSSNTDFARFVFQAAVPKYISMEWKPASASIVPANNLGIVSQVIKVKNNALSKPLMMKLKIQYMVGDRHVIEQAQVASFPIQGI